MLPFFLKKHLLIDTFGTSIKCLIFLTGCMQGNIFDCPLLKCLFVSGVAIHVCVCLLCARVFVCVYNYTLVGITRVQ